MELEGRKALVTGASRGLGREIALALCDSGVEVFGGSRRPEQVDWPKGIRPIAFDVSTVASVQSSWKALGSEAAELAIVVNNAGAGVFGKYCQLEFQEWESQIELMLLAPMKLSHLALSQWSPENPGALVNVSSLATEFPIPFMSGYNAAKSGLSGFTESLMQEVDPRVALVIEMRLGDLNTRFNRDMYRNGGSSNAEAAWKEIQKRANASPHPRIAALKMVRALRKGQRGTIVAGGFFQIAIARLLARLVSPKVKRAANLAYYKIKE